MYAIRSYYGASGQTLQGAADQVQDQDRLLPAGSVISTSFALVLARVPAGGPVTASSALRIASSLANR